MIASQFRLVIVQYYTGIKNSTLAAIDFSREKFTTITRFANDNRQKMGRREFVWGWEGCDGNGLGTGTRGCDGNGVRMGIEVVGMEIKMLSPCRTFK